MKKILIFGTIPPPIGGVSIHLERFIHFSKQYKNKLNINVYDIKRQTLFTNHGEKKGFLNLLNFFWNSHIIHIHISNNFKIIIALIAQLFRKKVIYTHHNSRVNNKLLFTLINYLSNIVILVNDKEIDIKNLNKKKIRHIPAFIPPYKFNKLDEHIKNTIINAEFIISTNCFQHKLLNNQDLYGFDLIIEAYAQLIQKNKLKKSILLLVDPSDTMGILIQTFFNKYPCLNEKNILFIRRPIDFTSLIKQSHLTIRATRSDGDSLSVRESLYLKVPIIASDITYRPEGTILFKNNNEKDLEEKILNVYQKKGKILAPPATNFADEIISLYLNKI